jgi:ferredoxin
MATMITEECINCGACEPECPNTAIYQGGVEWECDGVKHPALTNEIFYIVPEKCTECVGFYDHEACAAVCPVDCCVPNPQIPETHDVLLARAAVLHPDKTFGEDSPSRFKKEGGEAAAAPAKTAAAPAAASTPAAKPATAAPAAAPAATAAAAPVARFGKVERKVAPPLQQPPARTGAFRGELRLDFDEAVELVSPSAEAPAIARPLAVAVALAQPLLGALPAATKARLENAIGDRRIFSAAGATALNILVHLLILPIVATAFAVKVLGLNLYSFEVRPWFFWGAALAVAEAIIRLREAMLFARPATEVVYRGSFYGPLLIPLVAGIARGRGQHDTGNVAYEGYYNTAGAFDEKRERDRRYGEIYSLEERPGGYLFRLEFPRRIPPSGVKVELGLGDEMPDYAFDLSLAGSSFEVHGRVVDPRLRTVAATAPAFPPDFTTRVSLGERVAGFVYRCRDKNLEVVLIKQKLASRIPIVADAA